MNRLIVLILFWIASGLLFGKETQDFYFQPDLMKYGFHYMEPHKEVDYLLQGQMLRESGSPEQKDSFIRSIVYDTNLIRIYLKNGSGMTYTFQDDRLTEVEFSRTVSNQTVVFDQQTNELSQKYGQPEISSNGITLIWKLEESVLSVKIDESNGVIIREIIGKLPK